MIKTIIGLAALPGAGKTTIATILKEDYNFKIISVSDMLREIANARGLNPYDRSVLRAIRTDIGDQAISKWTLEQINNSKCGRFAIDAVRQLDLDDSLNKTFGDHYKILAIYSNQNLRWESRMDGGSEKSREEFIRTDRIELGYISDSEGVSYDTREIFNRARERGYEIRNDERDIDRLKATLSRIIPQILTS